MPAIELLIRPARPDEASSMTALCIRAKAHWGYDLHFMTTAARLLQIRVEQIEAGGVLAALRDSAQQPCGVAAIVPLRRPGWFELSHLFVAPECFGLGIGRALFDAAVARAADRGATHVSILSDPNAAGFYEKLGARRCGEAPSGVDRKRMLPLFELSIPSHRSAAAGATARPARSGLS
jgi:GNAT superfamily N-acetyltransferase